MILSSASDLQKWQQVSDQGVQFGPDISLSLSNNTGDYKELTFNGNDVIADSIRAALARPVSSERMLGIAFVLNATVPTGCFFDLGLCSSLWDYQFRKYDLELEIAYTSTSSLNVTYLNDFLTSDPKPISGFPPGDFLITPPNSTAASHLNEDQDLWEEYDAGNPAYGTLVMYAHDDIAYSTDNNREYNREPKQWERSGGGNPEYGPLNNPTWNTASIPDESEEYDFTANFYRLVDNQFKVYALASPLGGSGYQITDNIIGIDEDRTNGPERYDYDPEVLQKRNSQADDFYYVEVPFYDNSTSSPLLFLGWYPNDNEATTMAATTTIDYGNNKVTTTVRPDLHHKDTYSNTYTAYYGQFKAMAIEHDAGQIDITSALDAATSGFEFTGFDSVNDALQVKVPAEYNDTQNGVTYVFAGWWDGTYGTLVDNGMKVSRHIMVNNYATSQNRYDLVAMYKAHLNTGDQTPVTKSNSQRKIAVDSEGRHHAVYESAGLIWYTMSEDNCQTWTPEIKVNKGLYQGLTNGIYDGYCRRPAVAVAGAGNPEDIVITYVDEGGTAGAGVYVVRPEWTSYDITYSSELLVEPDVLQPSPGVSATGMPTGLSVPSIAINKYGSAKTWMAVWNDGNELRFSAGFDPINKVTIVEDESFLNAGSVSPQYPSIVWGAPDDLTDDKYEYNVIWRNDADVRFARLGIEEQAGIPSIDGNTWTQAGGVASVEVVHSGSSQYQVYPLQAVHAPSVTADTGHVIIANTPSQTNLGFFTFAAYEVVDPTPSSGGSKWPSTSFAVSPSRLMSRASNGIYSTSLPSTLTPAILRVNSRIAQTWDPGPGTTVVPWSSIFVSEYRSTPAQKVPLNPSVGIIKNPGPPFPWSSGYYYTFYLTRTLFQIESFQASVANEKLGGSPNIPTISFHAEGVDPNQPDVTSQSTVQSIYCDYSSSNKLSWSLENSQNNLKKSTVVVEPIEMRQMQYTEDSSTARMGVCNPRLVSSTGDVTPITWSSAIGTQGEPLASALGNRTDEFDITGYDSLYYERELLTFNRSGFQNQEFLLQLRNAETHEVVLSEPIRCIEMPEDSTYYELTGLDLGALNDQEVYMTLDISSDMDSSKIEVACISANLIINEELQKLVRPQSTPTAITLSNFPNPFNPSTDITYGIPEEMEVKLTVYDNLGREVKVLANGWKAAGTYTVTFDAADLPSGMYLYRIETAKGSVSKKMMLMK